MTYRSHRYLSQLDRRFQRAQRYIRCRNRRRFIDLLNRHPELLQHKVGSYSLLIWLVWRSDYAMVMELLSRGADPDIVGLGSNTALIHTAAENDERMARLLLDFGADVEKTNDTFETALGFACSYDAVEIVQLLCERGVDVNGTEDWGHSYLYSVQCATQSPNASPKQVEIERILISFGAEVIHTEPKLKP
jgi:ankyrin repeat protein